MRIVIIPLGQLPPDETGAEEIKVPAALDECYLKLVDAAREHLKTQGRWVAMVWDRRRIDGRFWVAYGLTDPLPKVPARPVRCRRS